MSAGAAYEVAHLSLTAWAFLACGLIGSAPIWWLINLIVRRLDRRDAQRRSQ